MIFFGVLFDDEYNESHYLQPNGNKKKRHILFAIQIYKLNVSVRRSFNLYSMVKRSRI